LSGPRILLCGRPDLLRKPGGDTRQILTLRDELGESASLCLDLEPRTDGFDLVHLFNLSRPIEPFLQGRAARRMGLPLVTSTIYQDLERYNNEGRRGLGRGAYKVLGRKDGRLEDARALFNLWTQGPGALLSRPRQAVELAVSASGRTQLRGTEDMQRWLLNYSTALVFNSDQEAAAVVRRFGEVTMSAARSEIVPVGIDPAEALAADPAPFVERYGVKDFVLCVGRVEDLKNQLALIHALEPLDVPLVLAGGFNPRHRHYTRMVSRAAGARPRTLLLGQLDRPMVASAMAAAAVHALPSWFETAGLVSMEAAAAGCAVVSTEQGYARAYLGDEAEYCDPGDTGSIRAAVERALARGPSRALRRRVMERYTVSRAAEVTAGVYERVLATGAS